MKNPYTVVLIAGQVTVTLWEESVSDEMRTFSASVDAVDLGGIQFPSWQLPRLSIGNSHILVWGGTRVYSICLPHGGPKYFQLPDEVHAGYELQKSWCMVCETSILLWSPDEGSVLAEVQHNEVFTKAWWASGHLFVEDFEEIIFEVKIDEEVKTIELNKRLKT